MLESMFIILSEKIEDSKEKAAIIMEDLQTDAEIVEEQVKAFVETVLQIWDKLVEEEGMADIFRSSKTETEKLERATGGAKYT
ncbi:MAG: hypothetical protein GWO20_08880 [Candidatus Korarchaeota archaeon]|nr:hypothetical protein [Candidatus Korarchaeota archaeon]NIU83539.1 hypothetical protein [Candidatus Thorarchaeota archaeon]NIW13800.1 hypothetical protein [Candidatus Thorarchaeota archaeon]NIW51928.1 hypothetical protein [Candidatus Korarchaeota archaeon]